MANRDASPVRLDAPSKYASSDLSQGTNSIFRTSNEVVEKRGRTQSMGVVNDNIPSRWCQSRAVEQGTKRAPEIGRRLNPMGRSALPAILKTKAGRPTPKWMGVRMMRIQQEDRPPANVELKPVVPVNNSSRRHYCQRITLPTRRGAFPKTRSTANWAPIKKAKSPIRVTVSGTMRLHEPEW